MHPQENVDYVAAALGWIGLAALVYLVYLVLAPFLIPLGWAAVFAIAVHPVHARLERRWGASWAAAASTVGVTVIVVAPAALIMTAFAGEAIDAAGSVQRALAEGRLAWVERAWSGLEERVPVIPQIDLASTAAEAARRIAAFLVTQSGAVLRDAVVVVFDLAIALFATFFLLRDSRAVMHAIRRVLPMQEVAREELIRRTVELVSLGVASSIIVAVVQGALGGVVFWAVGIDAPVFWGVVMAIVCLLPFGAWIVWLPAAILLAVEGEIVRAVILVALGAAVVSGADNFLRPMLVSGRARLNGLMILIGLFGGMSAFGGLGIVLGPIIVATAMALLTGYVNAPARDGWRA